MKTNGSIDSPAASTPADASAAGKRPGLGFDVAALGALSMTALVIGASVNTFRAEPLPWKYRSREQILRETVAHLQELPGTTTANDGSAEPPHEIRLEDFQRFVAEHGGLVLDVRGAVFYREAHIPGALNLPRETFSEDYPRRREQIEPYKDKPIAVYCSGADCPDGQLVADALTKLGYRRLLIYTSGWEEWSSTGLPQEGKTAAP